ncbi:MAG: DUF4860 domain-containing protein [Lachnospiraceae bacterium]|nr:DUF4860 domain-containing protein [Lachnospiraceae bacterium]
MREKRNTGNRGQAIQVIFPMLLFLVFVLCALFTVLIGGQVYENLNRRSEENFDGSVALQYVANKVRQGDRSGGVRVMQMPGTDGTDIPVLEIGSGLEEGNYVTWIYYYDGNICELFTDPADGLGLADGLPILECGGFSVSQSEDGKLLTLETAGEGGGRLSLSLRSEAGTCLNIHSGASDSGMTEAGGDGDE